MQFSRHGGLSSVKYKKGSKTGESYVHGITGDTIYDTWSIDGFHTPPAKKGIYAFISYYEEPFLVGWKLKEGEKFKYKRFEYNGDIWCHLTEVIKSGVREGCWVKTTTQELELAFKKYKHLLLTQLQSGHIIKDPYKRGLNGCYSRDELEVFIEGKDLNKIR